MLLRRDAYLVSSRAEDLQYDQSWHRDMRASKSCNDDLGEVCDMNTEIYHRSTGNHPVTTSSA